MGHKNKESLTFQIQKELESKLAIGHSKHQDKLKGGVSITSQKIYSWETFRGYMKHCNYFAKFCKENYGCKTLEQCREHIDDYLKSRSHLSAHTQKLEASAIGKLYGMSTKEMEKTAPRLRANISRSRGDKTRDRNFSETRNKDLVDFCRSTGLRRSELSALTGDKLVWRDNNPYVVVDTASKGGRYREAPIVGDKAPAAIERMMRAGTNKVFEKVPNGADIHAYRADYATYVYKMHERELSSLKREEKYFCRGDQKGRVMDRNAMEIASKALGHNRISVVASNYIR